MQKILPQIRALGAEVVVVSFTTPARVSAYQDKYHVPLLVLSDPTLAAYKAFALGRTSWAGLFRPATLFRYLIINRTTMPWKYNGLRFRSRWTQIDHRRAVSHCGRRPRMRARSMNGVSGGKPVRRTFSSGDH